MLDMASVIEAKSNMKAEPRVAEISKQEEPVTFKTNTVENFVSKKKPETKKDENVINLFDFNYFDIETENTDETPVERLAQTKPQEKLEPTAAETPQKAPLAIVQEKHDFRIDDSLEETGFNERQCFIQNVAAIKLLENIEAKNRLVTPNEQKTLAAYCGWGGLLMAFDAKNDAWKNEYQELKSILTEDEYKSAMDSVLNAHYTSPVIIKAMYKALEHFGFKGGNILEPSCGTGRFLGLVPESMKSSRLYGVEVDSISGRIAKQLYQTADIRVQGFETTTFSDNFFDVAIGNVPFGAYKLNDTRYDKYKFFIHDYFIAKSLDLVRPGGIVAFITCKGTLDKKDKSVRKYLAKRAELVGAIRLPNNAFKSAGTKTTTDILFLQKRTSMADGDEYWVDTGTTADGFPVNNYFVRNPNMMLGHMHYTTRFGKMSGTELIPDEDMNLANRLSSAVANLSAEITKTVVNEDSTDKTNCDEIPADPAVKNFTYTVVDGEIYYRENSVMKRRRLGEVTRSRVYGLISIRKAVRKVIDTQMKGCTDEEIVQARNELNVSYDMFVSRNGIINSRANHNAFKEDTDYPLLQSLEIVNPDGAVKKADMFTKTTIRPARKIRSVNTAVEALAVSLNVRGCIDIGYMASLCRTSTDGIINPDKIIKDLYGVIFQDPEKWHDGEDQKYMAWETSDEYLSGNVRTKLKIAESFAEKYPEKFSINVRALRKVQPADLDAADIDLRLGAVWIDPIYVTGFIHYLMKTPFERQEKIHAEYSKLSGTWYIEGKYIDGYSVRAKSTYGTSRINAYNIIERTLNLKDVRI